MVERSCRNCYWFNESEEWCENFDFSTAPDADCPEFGISAKAGKEALRRMIQGMTGIDPMMSCEPEENLQGESEENLQLEEIIRRESEKGKRS